MCGGAQAAWLVSARHYDLIDAYFAEISAEISTDGDVRGGGGEGSGSADCAASDGVGEYLGVGDYRRLAAEMARLLCKSGLRHVAVHSCVRHRVQQFAEICPEITAEEAAAAMRMTEEEVMEGGAAAASTAARAVAVAAGAGAESAASPQPLPPLRLGGDVDVVVVDDMGGLRAMRDALSAMGRCYCRGGGGGAPHCCCGRAHV